MGVFIVLRHDRRRVVHFNVTTDPTARWAAQQMVEVFPFDEAGNLSIIIATRHVIDVIEAHTGFSGGAGIMALDTESETGKIAERRQKNANLHKRATC